MPTYARCRGDGWICESISIPQSEKSLYEFRMVEIAAPVNGLTHFDNGIEVLPRPESPVTWTATETANGGALLNVPAGAIIRNGNDGFQSANGGTVELNFPMPGQYQITVESFPYLEFTTTVTVAL